MENFGSQICLLLISEFGNTQWGFATRLTAQSGASILRLAQPQARIHKVDRIVEFQILLSGNSAPPLLSLQIPSI